MLVSFFYTHFSLIEGKLIPNRFIGVLLSIFKLGIPIAVNEETGSAYYHYTALRQIIENIDEELT